MIIFKTIGRLIRFLLSTLDGMRRVLHFILLLLIFSLIIVGLAGDIKMVPESAALRIAPFGNIVEQYQGDAVDRALDEILGEAEPQALLHHLVESLEKAADDPRISSVVLQLNRMGGAGLSNLQTIGRAIDKFRESGKPVIAIGDYYSQGQYYLASRADEIYMHRLGGVFIDGFGYYRLYMKEALDKLKFNMHVFRAGKYKSYGAPYERDDMSAEEKEESTEWLGDLWSAYQRDVTAARELDADAVSDYANNFIAELRVEQGNMAEVAVNSGLVDELLSHEEMMDRLADIAGSNGDDYKPYSYINYDDYVDALSAEEVLIGSSSDKVGVIVAAGSIYSGRQPPGKIGSDSLGRLIRDAREDDSIKAVVLRIDSPGGSAFASEVIFQELVSLRDAGKPLVVSMGDVAASGGYWIALPADKIWANPTTITGSIGVIAMFPSFEGSLKALGLNMDGIGTTSLSGQFNPAIGLGEDGSDLIQLSVDFSYREFLQKVSENRDMSISEANELAQGRVWSGIDAYNLGLVDELGDLAQALDSAAELAGLDEYSVKYIERELSFEESLVLRLYGAAQAVVPARAGSRGWSEPFKQVAAAVQRNFESLANFNDPRGMYYYCFCEKQ
ncbi:MAG: signal peptide peptidase SppA [Proteobacteria bacterium]|nr:signal peptide peptidase SppA [Pseudomonadota bacterium]TDJ10473.1 MAG: signal peptide peptidase SppA [Gammaproteobacteria bacterium]